MSRALSQLKCVREIGVRARVLTRAYAVKHKSAPRSTAVTEIPESTESLFQRRPKDYISVWRVTDMLKRKTPPPPAIDYRTLKNKEWLKHNRVPLLMTALERTEVLEDLFNDQLEYVPDFKNILADSIKVNLSVSYAEGENGIDQYYNSALLGNYLEASQATKAPVVTFPLDGQPADSLYTLLMITPDYPFRLNSDFGSFVHWAVGNIPGNKVAEGETLAEYMPPLPTEYAGTFRYVFLLFRQTKKIDNFSILPEQATPTPASTPTLETTNGEEAADTTRTSTEDYTGSPLLNKRRSFVLSSFVEKHCDELDGTALPVGVSFFRSDYDVSVSSYYEKELQQTPEPLYIPPDVVYKQAVEESKKLPYSRFRSSWL